MSDFTPPKKVKILLDYPKTDSTMIRVSKQLWEDGRKTIDIRNMYKKKGDKDWQYGKGIILPCEVAFGKALATAIKSAFVKS